MDDGATETQCYCHEFARIRLVVHHKNSKTGNRRFTGVRRLQGLRRFNITGDDCRDGQCNRERAAVSLAGTFRGDGSAVCVDKFPNDGQPKAKPSMRSARSALCLSKPVENLRKKIGVNTLAVIDDPNLSLRSTASQSNLNIPARWCELKRIRQEVGKDLLQPV